MKKELKDSQALHQAETENNRKRSLKEIEKARIFAAESFAKDLLPVLDALKLSIASIADKEQAKGLKMAIEIFEKNLAKHGIKEIKAENQIFNPELHIAVTTKASKKHEKNQIIQVLQTGYIMHDRVIRAATVIVAS